MIITTNSSGTVTAFQRIPNQQGRKMGFICEANSIAEAIDCVVYLVAAHCSKTNEYPSDIIEKITLQ